VLFWRQDWICTPAGNFPAGVVISAQEAGCPDGPHHRALGNSMAVPVMRWIGRRIQAAESGKGKQ